MADTPREASRFALLEPTEVAAGELQLRIWDASMVPAVLTAAGDPEITRWNTVRLAAQAFGTPLTQSGQALEWVMERQAWDGHATWAACDATSGEVLGYVSLHHLQETHDAGEVGYWVLPAARGRRVGARAVAAAARYGFGALGLVRIELFHATDNPASCGVATGAGFILEGTARQAYRYGDGHLHDDHMHARLVSDPDPR